MAGGTRGPALEHARSDCAASLLPHPARPQTSTVAYQRFSRKAKKGLELRSAVGSIAVSEKGITALEQDRILLSTTRFLAWGFPDRSLRLGHLDSDKVCPPLPSRPSVFLSDGAERDKRDHLRDGGRENALHRLFHGLCPCVDSQSETASHPSQVLSFALASLRKTLVGHSDAVTCLVQCPAHGFVVSAGRDRAVLLWHHSELSLIRQLPEHPRAVTAVAVNDSTGDIATASASQLFVWSINGLLLASVNTSDAASTVLDSSQLILCLAFSTVRRFD